MSEELERLFMWRMNAKGAQAIGDLFRFSEIYGYGERTARVAIQRLIESGKAEYDAERLLALTTPCTAPGAKER